MSPVKLITLSCIAEILAMSSFATFPALMPHFFEAWDLTATEAGWINGAYFLGFTVFGLVSSTLTDRMDARTIVLVGHVIALLGAYGFAFHSDDFWSAIPWRFLSGVGLACGYMPGLKMLTDRVVSSAQPRAIAFYTACFSTGSAVSFLLVGQVDRWLGTDAALIAAVMGPPAALLLVVALNRPVPVYNPRPWVQLFNFKPVLINRRTMGYVIAYFCHSWELMAMRSFVVTFLTFAASQSEAPIWMDISMIATIVIFMGLPSSVAGNELAMRIGRRGAILLIMISALVVSLFLGFSANLPFVIVAALSILYGILVTADSSSITSGAVISSPVELKGSTMAVHSFIGFAGAMIGPVVAGVVLDAAGGRESGFAWGLTYVSMGAVALLAPLIYRMTRD
ncbi:MFS transporter [Sneathiella limimaris]|uniref:MFS transporter n=1 Tax=Sneathiella limimaris TaxID=1964213 RepID=UPI00146E79A5|nr:MFS transporter [Sneathiella limimaris]